MEAPFPYSYINYQTTRSVPGTVHLRDNAAYTYYQDYLLQKAMSVFKWQLPESWSKNFFLYCLYGTGYVAVLNTDRFGVIPQWCGLSGYNVFYQPTRAIVTNPLLTGIKDLVIGSQCEIIKLQPNYNSIMDLVNKYAAMMALAAETMQSNLINSKLAYVFSAGNKQTADSLKEMYDRIMEGQPAVFTDKSLQTAGNGWQTFAQNLGQNFIAPDVCSLLVQIENQFATEIGIPNANTSKKERMIVDEVNSNNVDTMSRCAMWLELMQEDIDRVNTMFGTDITVDWRYTDNDTVDSEPVEV